MFGKLIDYCDIYDVLLLQGVLCSLNCDLLGLYVDNLLFYGVDIWMLYEFFWLNGKGLLQVVVGYVELFDISFNLVELKSFKFYFNSFNQICFVSWQDVVEILICDFSVCVQGKVKVLFYCLDELEGQLIVCLYGICIDDQDIEIDNYQFSVDYLQGVVSGKIVEEMLVSYLLKFNCFIIYQLDWGLVQIQYWGVKIDCEQFLCYLVLFCYYNEFYEQCVECIFNDIFCFCQLELFFVYVCYM